MSEEIFRHKKIILERLEPYGFKKSGNAYIYDTEISDDEFRLQITIEKDSLPVAKLTESATGEEYTLYKTDAVGAYVGEIREAVRSVLQDIAERCCEVAIFKAEQFSGKDGSVPI